MVCDIDFIRKSLLLVSDIPIVKPGMSLYRSAKIVIPGFCPIHFTITLTGQKNVDRYTGNIVMPNIVKPEFNCIVFDVVTAMCGR